MGTESLHVSFKECHKANIHSQEVEVKSANKSTGVGV